MNIKISTCKKGKIGICGHAGIGHTHSHSGFVQDDSAGLAVAATILKQALPIDTTIATVKVDIVGATITVETKDGGSGKVWVRRGITPSEAKMMENIIGRDAVYSQSIVLDAFGRIYGQGVMEVPVSLQAAIVLAVIDTFEKKWANDVTVVREDVASNIGKILGVVVEVDRIPVSILLTVNASLGGIGPVEDLEGNVALGEKGKLMQEMGLHRLPTIIIESKNYVTAKDDTLQQNTFLIRANSKFDNATVANQLIKAASKLHMAHEYAFNKLDRGGDGFINACRSLGEKIIQMGEQFKVAETADEKVRIIADLAVLVSEDAGGVTFMSNDLQKVVGNAGMMKGTSAVISLLVTRKYFDEFKIPYVTEADIENYISIIYRGVINLYEELENAQLELEKKRDPD